MGKLHTLVLNLLKQLLCKVQAGRGSRRRALVLRVNRLVAVFVLQLVA